MILSHDSLEDHLRVNFELSYYHKMSLVDVGDMMPWERDVYLIMLKAKLEEEKEKAKNNE